MKLTLIILSLIFAFVALRDLIWPSTEAKLDGPIANWTIPDAWSLATGQLDDKPIITRYRSSLKPLIANASFQKQLGITAPLKDPREDGLPTDEEGNQLYEIEDEIRRVFQLGNESIFVGIISTKGMREFVLYTSNETAALAKAKALSKATQHHQLQFVINDDPEWKVYKSLFSKK